MEVRKKNMVPIIEKLGIPTNETWPEVEKQLMYKELDKSKTQNNLRQYLAHKNVHD